MSVRREKEEKPERLTVYAANLALSSVPFSCVFKWERVRINNSTLAGDSPWSHEWNLGNNANHLRCDVDPAERKPRAAEALNGGKTFSQRATEVYTHASQSWSRACCSIHHHDEALGSDQSQSVLHQCDSGGSRREGAPCPPAAQAGERNTSQHSLTCRSATPSILRRAQRESTAHQSRQGHTNTSAVLLSGRTRL